jgi:hypothetical protein
MKDKALDESKFSHKLKVMLGLEEETNWFEKLVNKFEDKIRYTKFGAFINFFRYELPHGIRNIKTFFKVVWKFRNWDSGYNLELFKVSLIQTRDNIRDNGIEIDETRIPKVEDMTRLIEIIDHKLNDDYVDMIGGYVYKGFGFTEIDEKDEKGQPLYEMKDNLTDEERENNSRIYKEAQELEDKENEEFGELMKKIQQWWD